MKKRLYISDLDGTLLDKNAEVSAETAALINKFTSEGGYFSIATARTAATAVKITEKLDINVPAVLMNGVCVYDIKKREYVNVESVPEKPLAEMLEILHRFRLSGFLFAVNSGVLDTMYENIEFPGAADFVRERQEKFGKVFLKTDDFRNCINGNNIVYYSVTSYRSVLDAVYEELRQVNGLHIEYYWDVYKEDYWYMEICSEKASKYSAVNFIRNRYGFEHVTGFGDNLNDIPLFKACDEAYAVENAKAEVKKLANGIIPSNTENGVARMICGRL